MALLLALSANEAACDHTQKPLPLIEQVNRHESTNSDKRSSSMKRFVFVSRLGNVSATRAWWRAAVDAVTRVFASAGRHWLLIVTSGLALGWPGLTHAGGLDPVLVGTWPGYGRGPTQAVAVQGGLAYVASGEAGLHILDIHNPAQPVRVGGYDTSGWACGVAMVGNDAYVADREAG